MIIICIPTEFVFQIEQITTINNKWNDKRTSGKKKGAQKGGKGHLSVPKTFCERKKKLCRKDAIVPHANFKRQTIDSLCTLSMAWNVKENLSWKKKKTSKLITKGRTHNTSNWLYGIWTGQCLMSMRKFSRIHFPVKWFRSVQNARKHTFVCWFVNTSIGIVCFCSRKFIGSPMAVERLEMTIWHSIWRKIDCRICELV